MSFIFEVFILIFGFLWFLRLSVYVQFRGALERENG